MKKNLFLIVLIVLIVLTAISALVSVNVIDATYAAIFIILFSILKFIGVSFYFMELKKAHIFWKASIVTFLAIFAIITVVSL
jgi:hypothetical protein